MSNWMMKPERQYHYRYIYHAIRIANI